MREFVKKTIWFALLLIVPMATIHVVCYFQKEKEYSKDGIYVWGDSQIYQGLDLSILSSGLSKQVLSAAGHASAVYDFLVSIEHIPDNSTCIIEFPEMAFFRRPWLDFNRSGLEFGCLWAMIKTGTPVQECIRIFILNRNHLFSYKNVFSSKQALFPYASELKYTQPLSRFWDAFNNKTEYSDWRIATYEYGISQLIDKGCRIVFIQFPFEKQVEQYAKQSVNRRISEEVRKRVIDGLSIVPDIIALPNDSLQMYDLSHLNAVGARHLTLEITEAMLHDSVCNRFFIVNVD
jgi:hypothetical protein